MSSNGELQPVKLSLPLVLVPHIFENPANRSRNTSRISFKSSGKKMSSSFWLVDLASYDS
jgi:hypothetical protein